MGGQGVFVREVQTAVLEGRAELAVHSAKDLPPREAEGLRLAAVPARGDVRDALVGHRWRDLPAGACVATGSVRRRAQLAWLRPDLTFVGLRGNIGTRLDKVGGTIDAVVVAAAALERLGLLERATEILPVSEMLPQVAQGALAVECAAGRDDVWEVVRRIEDTAARAQIDAERAFLDRIGGGCDLPVGALATGSGPELTIDALLASADGRVLIRRSLSGPARDPGGLGRAAAEALLAAGGSVLVEPAGA